MPEINIFGSRARQVIERVKPLAAKRKATEWWIYPNDWEAMVSMALRGVATYVGRSRIRHETCGVDAVILPNGDVGVLDQDNYTTDGYPQLVARTERFGPGEDQGCVRVIDSVEK